MRAYVNIENIKTNVSIDSFTFYNNDTKEKLILSFSEQDMYLDRDTNIETFRLKNEEFATFGLPSSLQESEHTSKDVFNFLRKTKLYSASIAPFGDVGGDYESLVKDAKLKSVIINICDVELDISTDKCKIGYVAE